MDFAHTEAQQDLAGLTSKVASAAAPKNDVGTGGFDRALWTDLAKAGVLDAGLPTAVGGGGFGLLEQCSVLIELGRTVAQVPYIGCITMAASALAEFGTAEHTEQWLVPVIRGDRILTAVLPDTSAPCGFVAHSRDDDWLLSGSQTAVAGAAFADGFLITADTTSGRSIFLVPADRPGLTVTTQAVTDHADAALVEATDMALADEDLLYDSRGPGQAAEWLRQRAVTAYCARQLGALEEALRLAADHTATRTQFDQVLGNFQAVRQRLADAYVDVEAVRLSLWQAAASLAAGEAAPEHVATAKFWAAEAGHRVAHTAVHVHGGTGIDLDYPVHRYFTEAKRNEFALGGATAQLRALATELT